MSVYLWPSSCNIVSQFLLAVRLYNNTKTQQYLRFQKYSHTMTCKKSINAMYMFGCNYDLQCTPKYILMVTLLYVNL